MFEMNDCNIAFCVYKMLIFQDIPCRVHKNNVSFDVMVKFFKTKRSKTFVNLHRKQIIAVHVQSSEIRSDEIGYSSDEFNILSLSCDLNRPINR